MQKFKQQLPFACTAAGCFHKSHVRKQAQAHIKLDHAQDDEEMVRLLSEVQPTALDWWGAEGHSLSLYVTIQNPHIQFADSGSHAGTVALSIDALIVTFSLSIFLTNDIFPSSLHLLALRFYSIIHIFFWNSFSYVLSLNTRFSTLELRASSSFCSIIVWTLLYLVVTYPLRHGITNWNKGTPWLCCSSRHNSDVARSHSFDGNSLSLIRGSSHDSFARTPPPKFH